MISRKNLSVRWARPLNLYLWRHCVATLLTPWRLFSHDTMRLYYAHVCNKFEANQSKNTATVAQKPPKWTFLRNNVATLLRHDVVFHMVQCVYTMSMYVPNLKRIGRKTRPQWPKNRQNGRFYAITSRRCYVMTSFSTWYVTPIPCSCIYQIWSKSVEKNGHSGPKTPTMDIFTS